MHYYKLLLSCDTKDTGPVYPQVQEMSVKYDYDAKNSVRQLGRCHNSFPPFEPNLNSFVLNSKAKPTDFLSNSIIGPRGFLLSGKAKNILESCNLEGYKFYKASVLFKKENIEYYWMHYIFNVRSSVNYKASRFFIYQNFSTKLDYIDVVSEKDLLKKEKKLEENNPELTLAIWGEKIQLDFSIDEKGLDFFKIGKFDSSYYVSERLYNLFEKHKITGVEFSDAENIVIT